MASLTADSNSNKRRKRNTNNIKLFQNAQVNDKNFNIFLTIHGDPQKNNDNIVGKVPDGIILVIIAPPTHVVHTDPDMDTETWRFFCQKNWPKSSPLNNNPHTCYGATRDTLEFSKKVKPESDSESSDSESDDSESDDSESSDSESGDSESDEKTTNTKNPRRVKYMDSDGNEKYIVMSGDDYDDYITFMTRTTSVDYEYGYEILNHIQVFYPGDNFYNQSQKFDEEELDFDGYILPTVNNFKDTHSYLPFPIGFYDGYKIAESETLDGEAKIYQRSGLKKHKIFNRELIKKNFSSEIFDKFSLITTEDILKYISKFPKRNGSNRIVVLNSCSPAPSTDRIRTTKKSTELQKSRAKYNNEKIEENLRYRQYIYKLGRNNFCELRALLPNESNPLLPLYDSDFITRIDNEDKNILYTFIGNKFKFHREKTSEFTENDFHLIYSICLQDRSSGLMQMFKKRYIKHFSNKEWKQLIEKHRQLKLGGLFGGKNKKRNKKTRKRKSRNRKSRKRKSIKRK